MATIDRRLAAIRFIHEQARTVGQLDEEALFPTEHPMVRRTRRNLARRLGTAPENRRKALYTEDIQRILTTLPDTPIGARDRALLLVGFAGGFCRSELVGIDVEHVEPKPNGIAVLLPKSGVVKGDWFLPLVFAVVPVVGVAYLAGACRQAWTDRSRSWRAR